MNLRLLCFGLVFTGLFGSGITSAQQAVFEPPSAPAIEDLGNQRYRIGEIEIDKAAGTFSVSGQVLRDEPPLEFLVATRGGHKSYESALEVNADAYQFNLACILIGLDPDHAQPSDQRVHGQPVKGDRVEVTISWLEDGKLVSIGGSEVLLQGNPPTAIKSANWVYTGSVVLENGRYLPDLAGTLLGFVHRGESIIEHQQGIGLGNYGAVTVNRDLVPAVGSAIELTIRKLSMEE